ncbi:unnamed protein product [Cyclocybe aegerita]|uniref:Protein SQS1 n=1 Tax=Cyclocybe aegerita TaxID=1973307 RepID=A0A8S0VXH7_CYCAE|nr:unnamed protein product [Cyclocybe aegerita]
MQEELDFTLSMCADAPPSRGNATPRGRGRGRGGPMSGPNSGASTPSRGRGRGGYDFSGGRGSRGRDGIGASPRGGRGRGAPMPVPMHRQLNITLSGLLYQERPLLRPIVFVPSVLTRVLFQEDDSELLKPGVEDVDDTERSHVPTADSVSRVFSGGDIPLMESDSDEDEDAEEIEEVDFGEVGKLFDDAAETKKTTVRKSKLSETTVIVEQKFTGFFVDTPPVAANAAAETDVNDLAKMVEETLSATDEPTDIAMADETAPSHENLFFVDTTPTPIPAELAPTVHNPPTTLLDDDDDIIVYVAPHPRNTSYEAKGDGPKVTTHPQADTSFFSPYVRPGPLPSQPEASSSSSSNLPPPVLEPPSLSSIKFHFSDTLKTATPARLATPPISTPRQAKAWKRKRERGFARKKKGKLTSFGAFGAMREEALLHNRDPQQAERRKGDSDLEWGDTDDNETADDVDQVFASLRDMNGQSKADTKGKGKARDDGNSLQCAEEEVHGMDIDPDMQMDLTAMKSFVGGLLGPSAGEHTTMADLIDAEVMRMEDEDDANEEERGSSGEEEEKEEDLMKAEEDMIIAEALQFSDEDDDDDDDDDDEDKDQTPRTSFQARLERLREKARSKKPEDESLEYYMDDDDDDDSDDSWPDFPDQARTAAERDEAFIQEIQDMLDENVDILEGRNKKGRKKLFKSILNGSFDDDEGFIPAKRNKDKGRDLLPELRAQWEKDRQKKAEYKKARELARLEAAADPLSKKKGGKKGRKAMLAAAALDPTITVIPNRVVDMTTLVQQIRRFIADIGGPKEMALPPTNKETRKNIHEMAIAFNLKSVSKGKGDARYTTLTKTTRSGVGVNEQKVAKIVRRSGGMGARGDSFIYDKKGRSGSGPKMPRHRDGDEVGGTAPKLNESNVGFRMLAMMGWAEGIRIGGATGGLDVPLTAIIKNSKLGLGATK